MSSLEITPQLTVDSVIEMIDKLSDEDLHWLAERISILSAQRRAACLPHRESDLMLKINAGLPEETWQEYHALTAKQKAGALSDEERPRLTSLIEQVETWNATLLGYLAELAQLRQTPLAAVMKSLGIKTNNYV